MTEELFSSLFEKLTKISEEYSGMDEGKDDEDSFLYRTYDLHTENGREFYNLIRDEQLLDILKQRAKSLNHSPAQKEVFWVWREYIKERFQRWPYALEAAGLKKAAGAGGKTLDEAEKEAQVYEELLRDIRKEAERLCRIPHPQEIPEICEQMEKFTNNWNDVIRDAGLDHKFFRKKSVYKIENLETEYREDLKKIFAQAQVFNRSPLKSEVDDLIKKRLIERCGTWRNALYQIGLEPVVKINPFSSTYIRTADIEKDRIHKAKLQDCYYRILHPEEQTLEDLGIVNDLKKKLNRVPDRKEISPDIRKRLQKSCGSWANALYQLQYLDA